jgi:PDZ domain-containing secreted protein
MQGRHRSVTHAAIDMPASPANSSTRSQVMPACRLRLRRRETWRQFCDRVTLAQNEGRRVLVVIDDLNDEFAESLFGLGVECIVADNQVMNARATGLTVSGTYTHSDDHGIALALPGNNESIPIPAAELKRWWPEQSSSSSNVRWLTWLVVTLVATVTGMSMIISSPFAVIGTQAPTSIRKYAKVSNAPDLSGRLEFPTFSARNARWIELPILWVRSWSQPIRIMKQDKDLGGTASFKAPKDLIEHMTTNASVAALESAGCKPTVLGSGVTVAYAPPGSSLKAGDTIVSAGGKPVKIERDLSSAFAHSGIGTYTTVKLADGSSKKIWLRPAPYSIRGFVPAPDQNVRPDWYVFDTKELSFKSTHAPTISIANMGIEGDSSGLAIALDLYQSITQRDITGGRHIVATGAIRSNGNVEPVGGIEFKIRGAVDAGADVVLVPDYLAKWGSTFGDIPTATNVVGVSSLDDAIEKLDRSSPKKSKEASPCQ